VITINEKSRNNFSAGDEGFLTLTIKMKVSPETAVIELMKRYRSALNYSVRKIIETKAFTISKAHKLLYNDLKTTFKHLLE
jgi:predicted transposase